MPPPSHAVATWLEDFAARVRARDLDGGRDLFAPDAAGFGTVTSRYRGLDDLVAEQWSDVWPRTTDFTFNDLVEEWAADDLAVVAATWRSTGTDGDAPRVRSGRVTLVLRRDGDRLVCVHSHFSMTPGTLA